MRRSTASAEAHRARRLLPPLRGATSAARNLVVRRVAVPMLGLDVGRRFALTLARRRYRWGGRRGRIVDWFLCYATPNNHERAVSAEALMELFFELVSAAGPDVFVEAGAKEASASVRATEAAIPEVIAFEANPYTYRRFAGDLQSAGVDYRHAALSEENGEVTFLVRRRVDGTPIADGQGSLLIRPDHEPGYVEATVASVRLDDAVDAAARTAIWVDVEGAVAEVLGGGRQVLERTDVAIIEVEEVARWVGQRWLAPDVVEQLARAGLRAVGRDMQSRWQFNIVFVRDDLLAMPAVWERISTWRTTTPT